MTVEEVINTADELQPNKISEDLKASWICEVDHKILQELYLTHKGLCDVEDNPWASFLLERFRSVYEKIGIDFGVVEELISKELLAPQEYSEIYVLYLLYKIAFYSGEFKRAENYAGEYSRLYTELCGYINRKYMPLQRNSIEV